MAKTIEQKYNELQRAKEKDWFNILVGTFGAKAVSEYLAQRAEQAKQAQSALWSTRESRRDKRKNAN